MSIEFKLDPKNQSISLYVDDQLITSLTGHEANLFVQSTATQLSENLYAFDRPLEQITLEDVKDMCDLSSVKGVVFHLEYLYRCFPEAHASIAIINDTYDPLFGSRYGGLNIDENFSEKELYFGPITNHHLRACLSDEVVELLMDIRGLRIYVGEELVDTYQFFDEENTYYYTSEENSDT